MARRRSPQKIGQLGGRDLAAATATVWGRVGDGVMVLGIVWLSYEAT